MFREGEGEDVTGVGRVCTVFVMYPWRQLEGCFIRFPLPMDNKVEVSGVALSYRGSKCVSLLVGKRSVEVESGSQYALVSKSGDNCWVGICVGCVDSRHCGLDRGFEDYLREGNPQIA